MSDVKAVEKRKVRPGEGGYITAIEEEGQTRRGMRIGHTKRETSQS